MIETAGQGLLAMLTSTIPKDASGTETVSIDGVTVYKITPSNLSPTNRGVILDFDGGGLIHCGDVGCRIMAQGQRSQDKCALGVLIIGCRLIAHTLLRWTIA